MIRIKKFTILMFPQMSIQIGLLTKGSVTQWTDEWLLLRDHNALSLRLPIFLLLENLVFWVR